MQTGRMFHTLHIHWTVTTHFKKKLTTMKHILIIIFFLGLLTSCSDPKPKVVYDNSTDTTENQILIDTTTITVAGLPIHFDSTNFIIHPIGQYKPDKRGAKIYMSSYSSGSSGLAVVYTMYETFHIHVVRGCKLKIIYLTTNVAFGSNFRYLINSIKIHNPEYITTRS